MSRGLRSYPPRVAVVIAFVIAAAAIPAASAEPAAGAPGPPRVNFVAAGPDPGAVNLQWLAPIDQGTTVITSYQYSMSLDGGTSWSAPASFGSANRFAYSFAFPALRCTNTAAGSKGCSYRIYGQNASGIGSPSDVVSTWVAPSAPDRASSILADSSYTKVLVQWSTPKITGGLPITYTVLGSMDGGAEQEMTATQARAIAVACTGALTCRYRVRAANSLGTSAPGPTTTFVTAPGAISALSAAVTGVDFVSGNTSVRVAWSPPIAGMPVTGYQLQRCVIRGGVTTGCTATAGAWGHGSTVATLSPSDPMTTSQPCAEGVATCRYRVRGLNARGGVGAWLMAGIQPWAPYGVRTAPGKAKGTVSVTFDGPAESGAGAAAAKHYQVLFCTSSCNSATRWRDSGLKIPYPPKGTAPFAAGTFACKNPVTTLTCYVRMRFIDGGGHTSALTTAITGSPRA